MYTIQLLHKNGMQKRDRLLLTLQEAVAKDGRFRINRLHVGDEKTTKEDRAYLTTTYGGVYAKWYTLPAIYLQGVRLTQKKEYCGNHPDICIPNPFIVAGKKPNSSRMEWSDWVAFHLLVNRVLNKAKASANVWTTPMELLSQGRRMWIRKGLSPRLRYEWETSSDKYGRRIQTWNAGDESQFTPVEEVGK